MTADRGHRKVGVVGLGKMGSALADALLAKRFEVTVWNRTPARAGPIVRAGATLAHSLAEAAGKTDILVVCLTDYAAIKAAVMTDDVGLVLRTKILVDVTSMGFEELGELINWTETNGISLLKGNILTYPDDVRAGRSIIVYGGPGRAFRAIAPVLEAMGGGPVHIGDNPHDGNKIGLAYGCFLYSAVVAFIVGAAICHRAGISIETYAKDVILRVVKGPILPGMLERLTKAILVRRYDEDMQATLNIWNASLARDIQEISSYSLDPGPLPGVKALLDRAAAQGFGEQDLAAVFEELIGRDR